MERNEITVIYDVLDRALQHAGDPSEEPVFECDIREAIVALEDLAEELKDRLWTGAGPTVEEAGGRDILARVDGVLRWARRLRESWVIFDARGLYYLPKDREPTGWRPMPKADH